MRTDEHPTTSIILATYGRSDALDLVLRSLAEQKGESFDVIVADDGSGPEVGTVVASWRARLDIEHVWQSDSGFRKARALNLAALTARGDYLLFLDGDCIPRRGFLKAIRRARVGACLLYTSPSPRDS